MALVNDHGTLIRGADGVLYDVSARVCAPVPADQTEARNADTKVAGPNLIDLQNAAPAQQAADPDDHGASRYVIDPGDHDAARYVIDPGDLGTGQA